MTHSTHIIIDGKRHRWRDILQLRRAQIATARATAQARQPALFATLPDDHRPRHERTVAQRYQQPSLFTRLDG